MCVCVFFFYLNFFKCQPENKVPKIDSQTKSNDNTLYAVYLRFINETG